MISRRTLFGRLLVAASAFVAAPAVRVEAAPMGTVPKTHAHFEGDGCPPDPFLLHEARAEGYERGRAVEQAKAESRAMVERPYREVEAPALTFTRDDFLPARPVTDLQIDTSGYRGYPLVIYDRTASKGYVYYDGQWHENRAMHAALDRMGLLDPITDDFGVRIAT